MDIYHRIFTTNRGKPWFGTALENLLEDISFEEASYQPEGENKSIAHFLTHLIQWRVFCLNKAIHRMEENIQLNSEEDWPVQLPTNSQEWETLKSHFFRLTDDLMETVQSFNANRLGEKVPGKDYSFEVLFHGIVDHDLYHFGQITELKRLFRFRASS